MLYWPYAIVFMALFVLNMGILGTSHAGELRAAPWTRPPASPPPLPPEEMNFDTNDEGGLPKMSALAEQGHVLPAALLASHHQDAGDFKQAVRWHREAVRLGHVASAFELANLYFPLGGSLGREKLPIRPDIVTAACWHAIGIAGISSKSIEDATEWPEYDEKRSRQTLNALEAFMLPSEKIQAKAILAAWPDSLPPEGSTDNLPPENNEERQPLAVDAFIPLFYDYLGGKGDNELVFRAAADEKLIQTTLESLQAKAATGDDDARYAVAWFQLMEFGTEQEKNQAHDLIRDKAEQGEAKACVHLAQHYMQTEGSEEEAARFYRRAAEQGRADAMLGLALCLGQSGDREAESRWLEKAAGAGNVQALMGLVESAESAHDAPGLVKWLSILSLRHPDPHVAYRSRVMLGYFIEGMDLEEMAEAMRKAEEWHTSHPQ